MKMPCPACKKPVEVGATKCPHCQTEYTPEQIAEMKGGVKAGLIAIAVIFVAIFLLVWTCSGEDEDTQQDQAESPVAVTFTLNDAQQGGVDFVRAVQMQAISCSSDVERAQDEVNKAAGGTSDAVEAYRVLSQAEKSCASAVADIRQIDIDILANAKASGAGKEALKVCSEAAATRQQAMALGKQVLEGENGIKVAADFRDKLSDANSSDQLCKLQLRATVELFELPDGAVDFLQ